MRFKLGGQSKDFLFFLFILGNIMHALISLFSLLVTVSCLLRASWQINSCNIMITLRNKSIIIIIIISLFLYYLLLLLLLLFIFIFFIFFLHYCYYYCCCCCCCCCCVTVWGIILYTLYLLLKPLFTTIITCISIVYSSLDETAWDKIKSDISNIHRKGVHPLVERRRAKLRGILLSVAITFCFFVYMAIFIWKVRVKHVHMNSL